MTTQATISTIPVIDSTHELYEHQFDNRYAIYCHDPYEYEPVSIELIAQLATELKAENAVIVINQRGNWYLTADSFDTLQDKINEKESDKDYLAEGYGAYLLDIDSSHFYYGYPKLFWKDCLFDDRVNKEDEWGEVCYQNPINKRNLV